MSFDLITYLNTNGYPLLRRCVNCIHWVDETEFHPRHKLGYCKFKPMYFAFTLEPSVYPLTKEFFVCENHKFYDEEKLKNSYTMVNTKDVLKDKKELKEK